MSKWISDDALDTYLNCIRSNCDKMIICSQQPTTYTEATTTYALATADMTVNTDYTLANGTASGRKITTAVKSNITPTGTGGGNHVAFCQSGASKLWLVTNCSEQNIVAGNPINIPAFTYEALDPE